MRFTGFIGPSYTLRSRNFDCQRCINLYPEIDEIGTGKEKEVAALFATPGLLLKATLGSGPIRAIYTAAGDRVFVVSGNQFFELNSDFTSTNYGTLVTTAGIVSVSDNGLQVILVDGPNGYYFDLKLNTFQKITDPNFLGSTLVTYQDGYFIFNKPGTNIFYISGINAITFNGLDVGQAGATPDNIIGQVTNNRDLWIMKEKTIQIFYDSGNNGFPYAPVQGAYFEYGLAAPYSVKIMNNTVFWLGRDDHGSGVVFMANGYQPQRISNHAIEEAIQSFGDLTNTVAYAYQKNGHQFYVLNFDNADTSLVFDATTNLWHERIYTNNGQFERHRANVHSFAFGLHIVGDYQNGNIYELSETTFSDNGAPITKQRVTPHQTSELKYLFYNSFQLDIESGIGLDGIGQGTDPKVMLQFSDDGGHTWSNEKWASMGKIGQTKFRALWRRMGRSRDRVFKVSVTDPVKTVFIGAEVDVVAGES